MRTITFDLDTGEVIDADPTAAAITGDVAAAIAAHVLKVAPADVDEMYSAWFDPTANPDDPLAIGKVVLTEFGYHGVVIQRRITEGVLTGVQVRMDTPAGQSTEWFSPGRLVASGEAE
jgi:hypothetical protein